MSAPKLNLTKVEDSQLWKRLDSELKFKVTTVATSAAALLKTVVRHMPLYTLHDERHILNVVGWMDWLLEPVLQDLSPLEGALCLLSAYTHDLGMALPFEEHERLANGADPSFQRFRDQYQDHCRHISALRAEGNDFGAQVIENHLTTNYLRTTHADAQAGRLKKHLDQIATETENKSLFSYGGVDIRPGLELLSISHNQPVTWLREELRRRYARVEVMVGQSPVNFAFSGLVLRLADIMDFDSSRTPGILFHHLGLERHIHEFDLRNKQISLQEWRKHLAITGITTDALGNLTYQAIDCPHPAVEQSIRKFTDLIRSEVSRARSELERIDARDALKRVRLPEIEHHIVARPGTYVYKDWKFSLDQEEIMHLLMGEALYGDPSLCIRELLQNALDAVELRDLRQRFKKKQPHEARPVTGIPMPDTPGQFLDDVGNTHQFAVTLTWGQSEHGQWWIQVSDNGVGMTEETIEHYFTRLGKSSYRSPEFLVEQAAMKREGLLCTPISTFGIGILSCFMLAERIEVRTRAADEDPIEIHVSGPGSLFWAKPGNRTRQGSDVKLWLKPSVNGQPIKIDHDWERCIEQLRWKFGYAESVTREEEETLDPAFEAARYVVWPKYPVHIEAPGAPRRTIDDLFHVTQLARLDDPLSLVAELGPPSSLGQWPAWGLQDWVDIETGSRVRIWFPQLDEPNGTKAPIAKVYKGREFWELLQGAARVLPSTAPLLLVNSVGVETNDHLVEALRLGPPPQCKLWVDLRGKASPRLTADRRRTRPPEDLSTWQGTLKDLWMRFFSESPWVDLSPEVALLFGLPKSRRMMIAGGENIGASTFSLIGKSAQLENAFKTQIRHEGPTHPFAADWNGSLARDRDLSATFLTTVSDSTLLIELSDAFWGLRSSSPPAYQAYRFACSSELTATHIIQEGCWPNLRESWAPLGLFHRDGFIGEACLEAPAICRFEAAPERNLLDDLSYDFCFPFTSVPLARLRKTLPSWTTNRGLRLLATLPFLVARSEDEGHFGKAIGAGSLYALMPARRLWDKPFSEWTDGDKSDQENISMLWDINERKVLACRGIVDRQYISSTNTQMLRDLLGAR